MPRYGVHGMGRGGCPPRPAAVMVAARSAPQPAPETVGAAAGARAPRQPIVWFVGAVVRPTSSSELCLSFASPRRGVRCPGRERGGSGRTAAAGPPAAASVDAAAASARATTTVAELGGGGTARCDEARVAQVVGAAAGQRRQAACAWPPSWVPPGWGQAGRPAVTKRTGRARRQRTRPVRWPPPGRGQGMARGPWPPLCWLPGWRLAGRPAAAFFALRSRLDALGGALLAFACCANLKLCCDALGRALRIFCPPLQTNCAATPSAELCLSFVCHAILAPRQANFAAHGAF